MTCRRQFAYFRPIFLCVLTITVTLAHFPLGTAINWSSPQQILTSGSLGIDSKTVFHDAAPAPGTFLASDTKIKFVDANSNSFWNPGESLVYDANANSQYELTESIIAGTQPAVQSSLNPDSKVKFVDTNQNTVWDQGETVAYDNNNNNQYDSSESAIAGKAPPLQGALNADARLKYYDANSNDAWNLNEAVIYDTILNNYFNASRDPRVKYVDTNSNNARDSGEVVTYDTDNDNVYDTGEPVISGTTPSPGSVLKSDPKIKFVDSNRSGQRESGEAVVYDTNGNQTLDSGEQIIVGATPPLQSALDADSRIKYVDANSNLQWNLGESVVYETTNNNYYNASIDPKVRFVDSSPFNNRWDPGESVVYDSNNDRVYQTAFDTALAGGAPPEESDLLNDSKIKFVDTNRNGVRNTGESIVYDTNASGLYDSGENVIAGTAPPVGTLLSEPVIAGAIPPLGTPLKSDGKLRIVDSNGNHLWDLEEAVAYDTDNSNTFNPGDLLILGASPSVGTALTEPLVSGPAPSVGSLLKVDSRLKYVESTGTSTWDPGEGVVYDSNNSGFYDPSEPVVAGGAGSNGVWDVGETVVYDSNGDRIYNSGDQPISGSAPITGSALTADSGIRFVDGNSNGLWNLGESVLYDTNNNGIYDPGEPTIDGTAPPVKLSTWPSLAEDALGRVWLVWNEKDQGTSQNPDLFLKIWDGTAWSEKQQLTVDPTRDNTNFVTPLSNQTMMILWSSNSTGSPEIVYRLYRNNVTNPYPTSGIVQLTSNPLVDDAPTAVQDRHGRIWVAWTRHNVLRTISDIYYRYFNGTAWSQEFPLPPGSSPLYGERNPGITQTKDGRMWVVFSSNDTVTDNLIYYSSTDGNLDILPSSGIPSGSWATKLRLFNDTNDHDHPSIIQSLNGDLYVFFHISTLNDLTANYGTCSAGNYATCITSGSLWTGPSSLTSGTIDQLPIGAAIVRDQRIWSFFTRQFSGTGATDQIWQTKSDPMPNIHDIGLRDLSANATFIKSGKAIQISIRAYNRGNYTESTNLTLKLNNTVVTTIPLTLVKGEMRLVRHTYQTAIGFWGRYILNASVGIPAGELSINQPDNSATGGLVRISPPGDVDGNGTVNILDAAALAFAYNTRPGDPLWNPNADIDNSGHIDILDAALLAFYYGKGV